jgi:hypothetical protein
MISKEESNRARYDSNNNIYFMNYKETYGNKFEWEEFTSDFTVVTYEQLKEKLERNNYFKV